MMINLKRLGYVLGIALVIAHLGTAVAIGVAMNHVAGIQSLQGLEENDAVAPLTTYASHIGFVGTMILLPAGALLIILSLSSLLKEKELAVTGSEAQYAYRSLAKRRTIGWGIDAIIIPIFVSMLFQTFGKGQNSVSTGFLQAFILIYVLFKDAGTGRSIGKMITGIKAVGPDGMPPSLSQSFKRNLPLLLPVVPWIAGGQIWGYRKQRIGEKWAGTHVELV